MNIQRPYWVLIHGPDSERLRSAIQVVSGGGGVYRWPRHRFQRWE